MATRGRSYDESVNSEDDVELIFRDSKRKRIHCLVLQEYDDKGVFILENTEEPLNPILGLAQIVHFFKRSKFLHHPYTIRDILRKYVEDVSIFEHSLDRMNLVTNFGTRVNLGDPPITLFQDSRTVTLYLQNKKYLAGNTDETSELPVRHKLTLKERVVILICVFFLLVTPYVMFLLITWEKDYLRNQESKKYIRKTVANHTSFSDNDI